MVFCKSTSRASKSALDAEQQSLREGMIPEVLSNDNAPGDHRVYLNSHHPDLVPSAPEELTAHTLHRPGWAPTKSKV